MVSTLFRRSGLASPRPALRRYAEALLDRCLAEKGYSGAEVSLLFCSRAEIHRLNREYLGHDKPTDVLSFPSTDNPAALRGQEGAHLGDIALSLEVCAAQAPDFGRTTEQEVALLLVHGLLHLMGYDHDTKPKERRMWAETDRLLALAAEIPAPPIAVKGSAR